MKMVIIGAGSAFGSRLSMDVLSRPELAGSTIALCDIDAGKLATVAAYVRKVAEGSGIRATIVAGTDRRELLAGADFVVIAVSIGGPAYYDNPYELEMGIPRKYGIQQTVGDTVGAGGVFRALRTAPALVEMARDVARLAPRAMILNYTNPMAMLTWALCETSDVPVVGLCHSVQGTAEFLASCIGAPHDEIGHWVAGINHMAWFLEFTHRGEDAYPRLRRAMDDPAVFARQPVRFEIMREFGYFVTESSRHMSEYVPWYQHDPDVMTPYATTGLGVRERRQAWLADMTARAASAEPVAPVRSHEYASEIMQAVVTGQAMRFNGNVPNRGLVSNLPAGSCVEVPCVADRQGIHPCAVGELPAQCAALCRSNVSVQELTVKAILERDRDAAYHAVLVDPSVGAVLSLKRARAMFDEMWAAEGDLLAHYDARLKRTA